MSGPLSSWYRAECIALLLKEAITTSEFSLTEAVAPLPSGRNYFWQNDPA
ncbi:MAG: hypothetical protein OHK0012_05460 [Synechococcales cyanobacterium]